MKTLYLLRHAEPETSAPAVAMGDFERVLTSNGVREAEALGDFMNARGAFPDFVLSSSSVRTLQTVRILMGRVMRREGLKVASHFDRALYLAPASLLTEHIEAVDDAVSSLLVVAHNPGIADLAQALSAGTLSDHMTDFPPCTLAAFEADAASWRDLSPSCARLAAVFVPERG